MNPSEIVGLANYPGYGVSRDGRVWSARMVMGKGGGGTVPYIGTEWRGLKPRITRRNYLLVDLRGAMRYVHRLVLEAFSGPQPTGKEGAHLNGDPSDHRVENLAWVTRSENQRHRFAHGTDPGGERNGAAKLTWAGVDRIRRLRGCGWTTKDIAALMGVSRSAIIRVLSGKRWSHT